MTRASEFAAVIILTEADVADDAFDLYAYMEEVYQEIGYRVVLTSALNQIGASDVRQFRRQNHVGEWAIRSGQNQLDQRHRTAIATPDPNI